MSNFKPEDGWIEVSGAAWAAYKGEKLRVDRSIEDNGLSKYWIWNGKDS